MSRLGAVVALVLVLGLVFLASIVRVTGPGRSGSRAAAPATPIASSGRLIVPVRGVMPSALVDSWGDARGGGTRAHHAIDIMAPLGTPVLAAADGRVEKLFESALGGHTLYQRSADGGTIYYYAHLDRYAPTLVEGDTLRAGQPIAAVGATGDAHPGAPHLHFEVHRMAPGERWWQGEQLNPFPILRGANR